MRTVAELEEKLVAAVGALRDMRSCIKRDIYISGREGTPVVTIGQRFERAWEQSATILAGNSPATPMLDQLAAPPPPITVQSAPSDRERLEELVRESFIEGYEACDTGMQSKKSDLSFSERAENAWICSHAAAALAAIGNNGGHP